MIFRLETDDSSTERPSHIKRQWGNQKCRSSGLLDATSSAPWEMRTMLLYSII